MNGLDVVPGAAAPAAAHYPPAEWALVGPTDARQLSPAGTSLRLFSFQAAEGSLLQWAGGSGDEALYVLSGRICASLGSHEQTVGAHGAVVIESAVAAKVRVIESARMLHLAPSDPLPPRDGPYGPPEPSGHGVHVVGEEGVYAQSSPGRDTRFYADSACPTCRITLMRTGREQRYVSPPHSHSQDELIHLLSGELTLGPWTLCPGDTLHVAADRRYTFTGGDSGFSFLNYRRDASLHTVVRGGEPVLEGGAAHGFSRVGDVVDLIPDE